MSKEEYPIAVKNADRLQAVDPEPFKRKSWWKIGGTDEAFVSVDVGYARTSSPASSSDVKLDAVKALGRSVWETEEAKELYKPIEGYEGAHRFDPSFKWTAEEENALIRKVSVATWSPLSLQIDMSLSSIGALLCQRASCSLLFNWTEGTSPRLSAKRCCVCETHAPGF